MKRTFTAVSIATLGVFLVAAAAVAAYGEAVPFVLSSMPPQDQFAALVDWHLPIGASPLAKTAILDNCASAITSIYGRSRPTVERHSMLQSCQGIIRRITDDLPSNSYGWLIGAVAAIESNDAADFNRQLQISQATGRDEQWVAEQRVELAEMHFDQLNEATRAGELTDLALLAQSYQGVQTIAQRYVADPAFRERITAVVEALPQADQQRFVSNVRRAAAEIMGS